MNKIQDLVIKINFVPLLRILFDKKKQARIHEIYYSLFNKTTK